MAQLENNHSGIFWQTVTVAAALLGATTAQATVADAEGPIDYRGSAQGVDLRVGATQSSLIQVYDEVQGVDVADDSVFVDGLVGDNLFIGDRVRGVKNITPPNAPRLPPGVYNSHIVHHDPYGSATRYNAVVRFDSPIIAVIFSDGGDHRFLLESDSVFGNAASYEKVRRRKLDSGGNYDDFTLVSPYEIRIHRMRTMHNFVDELRVITLADSDGDGVLDGDDLCPGTVSDAEDGVPSERLGTNRWADIDGNGEFDTTEPAGKGPRESFSLTDTGGCSCAQIIDELGAGEGHRKFGCSLGLMRQAEAWAEDEAAMLP